MSDIKWAEDEVVEMETTDKVEVSSEKAPKLKVSPKDTETVKVKVEEAPKVEKPEEIPLVEITLDNTWEEVVSCDKEGKKLLFNDAVGRFFELSPIQVRELSHDNRQRYFLAEGAAKFNKHEARIAPIADIAVSGRFASPAARLEVTNKTPGRHYTWKRTDEVANYKRDGYEVATEDGLGTADSVPSGVRKVTAHGEDELVLMSIPQELEDARVRAKLERNRRLEQGQEKELESQLGEQFFDPTVRRQGGTQFGAPVDANGNPLPNQ
jgi:hypothetical protein